jgi:hypothetical protein
MMARRIVMHPTDYGFVLATADQGVFLSKKQQTHPLIALFMSMTASSLVARRNSLMSTKISSTLATPSPT